MFFIEFLELFFQGSDEVTLWSSAFRPYLLFPMWSERILCIQISGNVSALVLKQIFPCCLCSALFSHLLSFPVLGAFRVHNPLPRIQWLHVIAQKPDFACHYFHPTMDKNMFLKNLYFPHTHTGERNRVSSARGLCYLTKCPNLLMIPQCLQFNYFGSICPGSISQRSLINGSASNCTAAILTSPWRKSWTVHLFQKGGGVEFSVWLIFLQRQRGE